MIYMINRILGVGFGGGGAWLGEWMRVDVNGEILAGVLSGMEIFGRGDESGFPRGVSLGVPLGIEDDGEAV